MHAFAAFFTHLTLASGHLPSCLPAMQDGQPSPVNLPSNQVHNYAQQCIQPRLRLIGGGLPHLAPFGSPAQPGVTFFSGAGTRPTSVACSALSTGVTAATPQGVCDRTSSEMTHGGPPILTPFGSPSQLGAMAYLSLAPTSTSSPTEEMGMPPLQPVCEKVNPYRSEP